MLYREKKTKHRPSGCSLFRNGSFNATNLIVAGRKTVWKSFAKI